MNRPRAGARVRQIPDNSIRGSFMWSREVDGKTYWTVKKDSYGEYVALAETWELEPTEKEHHE